MRSRDSGTRCSSRWRSGIGAARFWVLNPCTRARRVRLDGEGVLCSRWLGRLSRRAHTHDVTTSAFDPTRSPLEEVDAGGLSEGIAARSPFELFWRRFRQDKVALGALGFIVFLIICAVLAPVIVKVVGVTGPNVQNPHALDQFGTPTGPSPDHPMGVDQLGRDVFARVLYGARVSLQVAIIATAQSVFVGVVVALLAR